MQKIGWAFLLFSVSVGVACAQTPQNAETAFRDSILHHHFILRSFSGELEARAKWVGTDLQTETPKWKALGLLLVEAVDLKGEQLDITGDRQLLVRDKTGQLAQAGYAERVTINVDLAGSDVAAVLPQLKDKLFFGSIDEALAAIPEDFRSRIPPSLNKKDANPKLPQCDCAAKGTVACVGHDPLAGIHSPRVSREVDFNGTKRALQTKAEGSVRLGLLVDSSGRIADVWIVIPFTMGLDQDAAQAALQYEFTPATCHGKTMRTAIYLDVIYHQM